MKQKYTIGDVVRRHNFDDDTWCVIATRQQPLTTKYLQSLPENGMELKVDGLGEMARVGISVDSHISSGMHYILKKILHTTQNGFFILDEKNVYCFENDLFK